MATKHDNRCADNSADDEPIFTLCARDPAAPAGVYRWIEESTRLGVREEKLADARQIAAEMVAWQQEHGAKAPD